MKTRLSAIGKTYRFLVISGQFRLGADTIEAIAQFVTNGGTVIVEGTSLESGLLEKLGLPAAVKQKTPASISHDGELYEFNQYYELSPQDGETLSQFDSPADESAVVCYIVGDGQVVCIATEFFYLYDGLSHHGHSSKGNRRGEGARNHVKDIKDIRRGDAARNYVEEILEAVLPDRPITVEAPDYFEVAVNTKDSSTLVNLVDRSLNWKGESRGRPVRSISP